MTNSSSMCMCVCMQNYKAKLNLKAGPKTKSKLTNESMYGVANLIMEKNISSDIKTV